MGCDLVDETSEDVIWEDPRWVAWIAFGSFPPFRMPVPPSLP
jgi:hypothetical protein